MWNFKNNKVLIFGSLLTGLVMNSCGNFLDVEPTAIRSGDNFIVDDNTATETVNAIYNAYAMKNRWADGGLEAPDFYIGELLADDAEMGSHDGDFDDLERLIRWTPYSDNIVLSQLWKFNFNGIYRSDYALDALPTAPIDQKLKDQLMGESYFFKGLFQMDLVKVFNEVPLTDDIVQEDQYGKVPQVSFHEGFEMAAANLQKAIPLLPKRSEYSAENLGRATKGAAEGMLARLYMYQAGMDAKANKEALWDSVYNYTSDIISSGEYSLDPNYAEIYEQQGENNSGSLFEIQYGESASLNQGLGNSSSTIGNTLQTRCGIRSAVNEDLPPGWGYFQPTQSFVDSYEKNDPRLSCQVYGPTFNSGITYGKQHNYNLTDMQTEYYNRKLAVAPEQADALMSSESNSDRNQSVIRYADVLLMNAEAAYHIGKSGEAAQRLEQVRSRARKSTYSRGYVLNKGDEYTATGFTNNLPQVTSGGEDLLKAIWHERHVELGLESLRYWDLVRTGRYLDILDQKRANDYLPGADTPHYANDDLKANCEARCVEGPRGGNDIPVFPIPNDEAIQWNLHQVVNI